VQALAGISTEGCLTEARLMGEYLRSCVRRAVDGSPVWLKSPRPDRGETKPQALGPHLYAGCVGVALFLAALGHVLGEDEWRDLARRSLAPLRSRLSGLVGAPPAPDASALKIGGLIGLGSLIYSFVRIGIWLGDPTLLEEACGLATLITPERIAADDAHDLMFGSAGALLGLLVLDREADPFERDRIEPLERAVACGENLLRHRAPFMTGEPRGWPYKGGPPVSGFAHGASGIAYALALLARRAGRDDFRQAALEGLAFERLYYAPEEANWRPSRESLKPPVMVAWCNGAPGIALARLRLASLLAADDEIAAIRAELSLALDTTRDAPEAGYDFVCCGNMGRAEILVEAAMELGRDDLLEAARQIASGVAGRGDMRQFAPSHPYYNPGFFRGAAGLGYSFLRCADPASLPCVLALG
jgi:lantibiotic modifying enzyme